MPWEKSYDEAKVLEAAMRAFWAQGYQGTSMADLVTATGLNRGSLYAGFGNKRDLFIRALVYYDDVHRGGFIEIMRSSLPPRDAILTAFEAVAAGNPDTPGGCLAVNSAMELSPHDPEIARLVESSMAKVEAFFMDCLTRARISGDLPAACDPASMAKVLLGLMVGLQVISRANRNSSAITSMLEQVRSLLG